MSEDLSPPAAPAVDPTFWHAQYAAIYLALHHITSAVKDIVAKVDNEPNPKHRVRIIRDRLAELREAAKAIDMYNTTPPKELGRTYDNFLALIASNEHLRRSNANLASNFRIQDSMLREICEALGGGLTGAEMVEEIKVLKGVAK